MLTTIIDVLTPRQFNVIEDYRLAMQTLCQYPTLIPDVYDGAEPVRTPFDCSQVEGLTEKIWNWRHGKSYVIWKRRTPKSWGAIHPNRSPTPRHARIHLHANTKGGGAELIAWFGELSRVMGADFGFLEAQPSTPDTTRPSLFAHTRDLLKAIPQFFWATIFGPPYVDLFGRDRLISVPAAVNVELAPNLFYIQLTDRVDDTIERPEMVDKARQVAKGHLGLDAFEIAKGSVVASRLPSFSFIAPLSPV